MEKGWRIITISCKGCEMEWIMGRDNEPLFLVAVGQIFTCYCLERYLRHSKRRQRAWTSLTQGWAESGRNPSAENGSEFRAKGGGSKIAGVKKKCVLSSTEVLGDVQMNRWTTYPRSSLVYLDFRSSISVSKYAFRSSESNRLDCSSVEITRMLLLGRKEGAYGQALSTDERQ